MSAGIESVVLDKICISNKSALQLDESTDIRGHAQLMGNVSFLDGDAIRENFFFFNFARFCQKKNNRRGNFLGHIRIIWKEEDLRGKNCPSFCSDGTAAMVRRTKGFVSRVKGKKPRCDHSSLFLYREAHVAKTLPADFVPVLDDVVRMVNFVKSRSVKSRIFAALCEEMGAEYKA